MKRLRKKARRFLQPTIITIDGLQISASKTDVTDTIRQALYKENYEEPERRLVKQALRSHDRVLEIGAGIGLISLTCAQVCGCANLISYEPNPRMRPVIEKNFALNGWVPNLRSRAVAIESGEIDFYFTDNIFSSSLYDRDMGKQTRVACDGIEDVMAEINPTVLVLDVEGAEVDLLPKADLSGVDKIVVEMHPHIVGEARIELLQKHLLTTGFKRAAADGISELYMR